MALSTAASAIRFLLNRLDRIAGDGPIHPDIIVRVPTESTKTVRTVASLLRNIVDGVQSSNGDPKIVRRFIAETLSGPAHPTPSTAYKAALDAAKRWFRVVAV